MTNDRSCRGALAAVLLLLTSCEEAPQELPEPWEAAGQAAEQAYRTQQMDQAESGFREAMRLAEKAGSRVGRMRALEGLAASHASSGKLDVADSLFSVLLESQRQQLGADSLSGMVVIRTLGSLGEVNIGRGDIPRAEMFFVAILEMDKTGQVDLRPEEPALAYALQGLGQIHAARGEQSTADSLRGRAIGLRLYGQGFSLYIGDDLARAEEAWQQALDHQVRVLGEHADVARTAYALGQLFEFQGRRDDAIAQYHRAVEIYTASGAFPTDEARVLDDLANLLQAQDPAQSERLRQRAAQVRRSMDT
jgi:tetratricopeptide (TPR) repeat protein